MTTILEKITAYKREEVAAAKRTRPLRALMDEARKAPAPRGFRAALETAKANERPGLIAEIKKASPSAGLIRADFDPQVLARAYERGGAACLSVLTDAPSFQGDLAHMKRAHDATRLPVLRKDFMLDPYQVVEARAHAADCVLVILSMVDDATAGALVETAGEWEMDVLIEVHDELEVRRAIGLDATLVGINNRDLKTFVTDIATSIRLKPRIPSGCHVVAESGLSKTDDLERLAAAGISSYLIGETLMRAPDVEAATRALLASVTL